MNNKLLFISITLLGIIVLFLIFEHRVHLYGFVPLAVFIIFIGLHFFMHMGMGHGEKHEHEKEK
ncbi:MAG: DUF2933 domain-containing protein [Actinobacteria bacterium]|nr:DUF2933 domain-containing protein [Actinomycetota bacterium]